MCGIAGIHMKDNFISSPNVPLEALVDGLLRGIEPRGRDAAGFVAVSKNATNVLLDKLDVPASAFVQCRKPLPADIKTVLLHTRLATQGKPENPENNHPVQFNTCFVTHNGVINNDYELFEEYKDDLARPAEVDSIIIPAMIHKNGFAEIKKALEELEGSMAIGVVDPINNPNELILARGGYSPLVLLETDKFWMWASTRTAMEEAWKNNYGTPPHSKHFRHVGEGKILHFVDDEVKESRFTPNRATTYMYGGSTYRGSGWSRHSRQRTWWEQEQDDWDYQSAKADDTKNWCFQCGDKIATAFIVDGYNRDEDVRVEWDYPVCEECKKKIENKEEQASYRFAKSVDMKSFSESKDEKCALCKYWFATATNSSGERVCRSCLQFEKMHQENAELTASDVLTLRPGDKVPSDIAEAIAPCEACHIAEVAYIGKDGFGICYACFVKEGGSGASSRMQLCDACDEWFPKAMMNKTAWGKMCDDCASTSDDDPDNNYDVREEYCDNCGDPFDITKGVMTGGAFLCNKCYLKMDEDVEDTPIFCAEPNGSIICGARIDSSGDCTASPCLQELRENAEAEIIEAEFCEAVAKDDASPLDVLARNAEHEFRVIQRACVETAWEMGTSPSLVAYAIFFCPSTDFQDKTFNEFYIEAQKKYNDNLWLVKELIKDGRADLLERIPMPSFLSSTKGWV